MLLAISCVLYYVSMGVYIHAFVRVFVFVWRSAVFKCIIFLPFSCVLDTDYIHLETLKLSLRYSGGIK